MLSISFLSLFIEATSSIGVADLSPLIKILSIQYTCYAFVPQGHVLYINLLTIPFYMVVEVQRPLVVQVNLVYFRI